MRKLRNLMIITVILLGSFVLAFGITFRYYSSSKSNDTTMKEVVIPKGSSGEKIGNILYEEGLIKSSKFFKLYLKLFNVGELNAGKYSLNESMNLDEIIAELQKKNTYNDEEITISFPEGLNMRQMAKVISDNTNNSYDDVLKTNADQAYLKELINEYWFITDDILNSNIYYPLEGYLYPDTYKFTNRDVSVKDIFKKLLDEMDKKLSNYKDDIAKSGYSVHELLTLGSLAEKEVTAKYADDRNNVTCVFINRLNKKMSLGSDVTTRYAIKLDDKRPLTSNEYNTCNAYNTRCQSFIGLPAGPISNVSLSSIKAAIYPASNNYLYFVANIQTGQTFFFDNYNDFAKKVEELRKVNGGY